MTDAPAVVRAGLDAQVSDDAANLIRDSLSPNTRRAYKSALKTFDASGHPATDAGVANYLGELDRAGKSVKSAQAVVAALRFRARDKRWPDPVGPVAELALAGFTRAGRIADADKRPRSLSK